jgi:hypothetical protein
LADDNNVPRMAGLPHAPGVGFADEMIRHLNLAAIAAPQRPEQVSRLFADHLTLAVSWADGTSRPSPAFSTGSRRRLPPPRKPEKNETERLQICARGIH